MASRPWKDPPTRERTGPKFGTTTATAIMMIMMNVRLRTLCQQNSVKVKVINR